VAINNGPLRTAVMSENGPEAQEIGPRSFESRLFTNEICIIMPRGRWHWKGRGPLSTAVMSQIEPGPWCPQISSPESIGSGPFYSPMKHGVFRRGWLHWKGSVSPEHTGDVNLARSPKPKKSGTKGCSCHILHASLQRFSDCRK